MLYNLPKERKGGSMNAIVARLFLSDNYVVSEIKEVLTGLGVGTIDKTQPTNGSRVVNIFDQDHVQELIQGRYPKREMGIIVVSQRTDTISDKLDKLHLSLREKGVDLMGAVNPLESTWKTFFRFYIFGR
jgi:hypothetical protein